MMKSRLVKCTAFVSAILMVLSFAVGCSDTKDDTVETTTVTVGDNTEAVDTTPVTTSLADRLGFEPEPLDRQINIIYGENYAKSDFFGESDSGEIVSTAVFDRNVAVEEKLGVTFNMIEDTHTWDTRADLKKMFENANQAGTHDYDIIAHSAVVMSTMMYSGLFYNLCDVESIDFDHDWWMKNTEETYGVMGNVFGLLGDVGPSYYSNLGIIAYNKNLASDFGVADTFGSFEKLVYDGKFTVDKMLEIGATYGMDTDGDGAMTNNVDVFGFVERDVPSRMYLASCELDLIMRDADDHITVQPLSERAIDLYDKLYSAFQNKSYPNITIIAAKANVQSCFASDKALMAHAYFADLGVDMIRNMTSEYGVLPMPKYDENQTDYVTPIATEVGMISVSGDSEDPEAVGMVLEYMGCIGKDTVIPAYIETTLKLKYATDQEMSDMMQFIIERSSFALSYMFMYNCENPYMRNMYAFGNIAAGGPNISSTYASSTKTWQKQLDRLLKNIYND